MEKLVNLIFLIENLVLFKFLQFKGLIFGEYHINKIHKKKKNCVCMIRKKGINEKDEIRDSRINYFLPS